MIALRNKYYELKSRFYRWLFAKAFPNVNVTAHFDGWSARYDVDTFLYSKPVGLLTKIDVENMSSEAYKCRFNDPKFRARIDELYDTTPDGKVFRYRWFGPLGVRTEILGG